jgi:hypothetical protein
MGFERVSVEEEQEVVVAGDCGRGSACYRISGRIGSRVGLFALHPLVS